MVDLNRVFGAPKFDTRARAANLVDPSQEAAGIGALGKAIQSISADYAREVRKEESINFIENSSREYKLELSKLHEEMKLGYGEDLDSLERDFKEQASVIRDRYLEESPNIDAKNAFSSKSNSVMTRLLLDNQNYVNTEKIRKINRGHENALESIVSTVELTHNLDEGIRDFDEWALQVSKSSTRYPTQKAELIKKGKNALTNGYLSSLERKDLYDEGLKFFEGKSDLVGTLTDEQQRKWVNRFKAGQERLKQENYISLNQSTKLAISAVDGGELKPNTLDQIFNQVQASKMDADKKEALRGQLALSKVGHELRESIGLTPPNELSTSFINSKIDATLQDFKVRNPLMGSALKAEAKKDLGAQITRLKRELEADPVSYFVKRDKNLSDLSERVLSKNPEDFARYKAKLDSYYDRFGVSEADRTYVTQPMRDMYRGNIEGFLRGGDFQGAASYFQEIENMAGEQRYTILDDLKLNEYGAVGETKDFSSKVRILSNMAPDITKRVNAAAKDKGLKDSEIRQDLIDHPLFRAYQMQGGRLTQSIQNADNILSHVSKEYKRLVSEEEMGHGAAMEQAWGLFRGNFTPVEITGGHSVMVPANIQASAVEDYLRYRMANMDETVNELNIKLSENVNLPREDQVEDLKNRAIWVTSADRNGARLMVRDGASLTSVTTKENKPVTVDFRSMEQSNFKAPTKVDILKKYFSKKKEEIRRKIGTE